jgi:predicted regulator of Ras-like GTPase activity (Roadblock/LC7/MglB family)
MVVGHDGIVIASDLSAQFDNDTIGALASSISSTVSKSLERMKKAPMSQLTIEAEQGKFFISSAPVGYLIVTTENRVNMGLVRLEMRNAVSHLDI